MHRDAVLAGMMTIDTPAFNKSQTLGLFTRSPGLRSLGGLLRFLLHPLLRLQLLESCHDSRLGRPVVLAIEVTLGDRHDLLPRPGGDADIVALAHLAHFGFRERFVDTGGGHVCLLYTSPSPRDS
eukprot:TRINITY_DN23495_c0_g1_i6.p1 TRINITY_DN23495_c0_g1~~TRINITY_DN23495_c0_g1_i6.p1  ORF type:complete len:125 (-),score=5.66 TRINITY_DN23495_c0_g1_i6:152-526(-)